MGEIYATIGTMTCVVMLASGYKSYKNPESKYYRLMSWVNAAILGIMLFVDSMIGIVPRHAVKNFSDKEIETMVVAMKDTEEFLKRIPEVESVNYSSEEEKMIITVYVSPMMSKTNMEELKEEIGREFMHNLIDEDEGLNMLNGGGYNRIIVKIEKASSAKGRG